MFLRLIPFHYFNETPKKNLSLAILGCEVYDDRLSTRGI